MYDVPTPNESIVKIAYPRYRCFTVYSVYPLVCTNIILLLLNIMSGISGNIIYIIIIDQKKKIVLVYIVS